MSVPAMAQNMIMQEILFLIRPIKIKNNLNYSII